MARKKNPSPVEVQPAEAIVMLPMKSIIVDKDWNLRERMTEIDALGESIKRDGQRQPGEVVPAEGGKFILINGFRRYFACKAAGVETYKAQINTKASSPAEARWFNLLENIHRHGLSGYEAAKGFSDYAEQSKLPKRGRAKAISERFGVSEDGARLSEAHINNLLRAYEKLCEKALKAWAKGEIIDHVAVKLSARDPEEQEKLLSKAKGQSVRAFDDILNAIDNPPPEGGKGNENTESDESNKPRRQSQAAIKKGIQWARENGWKDVEQVLRWSLGLRKTMEFEGTQFDPKTYKPKATEQ